MEAFSVTLAVSLAFLLAVAGPTYLGLTWAMDLDGARMKYRSTYCQMTGGHRLQLAQVTKAMFSEHAEPIGIGLVARKFERWDVSDRAVCRKCLKAPGD